MSKTKLFSSALTILLCTASLSYGAITWSPAFDFDGTPTSQPVEINTTTPIFYSTDLANGFDNSDPESISVTVTSQNHPAFAGTLLNIDYYNMPMGGATGTVFWNFNDPYYADFPRNDTYTLQETIVNDYGTTHLTRSITLAPEPAVAIVLSLVGMLFIRRRMKGIFAILLLASLGAINALADATVSSVTCQQGWPLSRKVIIKFNATIDGTRGIKFYGTTDNGATTFDLSDKGTLTGHGKNGTVPGMGMSGTYTTVWEPDSTLDTVVGKIKIGIEIPKNYMVVDLSNNSVSYTDDAPSGGFNVNEYKTTKMAFRYVPAGTFSMGSPSGELGRFDNEVQHQVTLTKGFYVGIFEVTDQQYGTIAQVAYNTYRPMIARDDATYSMIRGSNAGAGWPASSAVDSDSFLGKLRAATGLPFDLPTEAQWEYACRATTTTALNSGKNLSNKYACQEMDEVGAYMDNEGYPTTVGSYRANNWGLYDMHGNVLEFCLDWYDSVSSGAVTDPKGPNSGSGRVVRGGNSNRDALYCRSAWRGDQSAATDYYGFRLVLVP